MKVSYCEDLGKNNLKGKIAASAREVPFGRELPDQQDNSTENEAKVTHKWLQNSFAALLVQSPGQCRVCASTHTLHFKKNGSKFLQGINFCI